MAVWCQEHHWAELASGFLSCCSVAGLRTARSQLLSAIFLLHHNTRLFFSLQQRIEIHKLRQGDNLILGFSIGGGIDQDPTQNPFSEDKTDKGIYVTRVTEGGPAEVAGLQIGDKIMQVNGWDMTMVTHDQARKRLTKRNEEVVRLLVTRQSLQKAVQQSLMS